ncbi:uncharacterized protein LOC143446070 [Clavelina lepadiformis]|uniref:Uncharacterized protein n=1 Tax=Clavelina lepadiformis TaxID=159417 RepID=A0ABP0GTN8_CLALP
MDLKTSLGCGLLLAMMLSFPQQTSSQCTQVGCFDCFDWCETSATCNVEIIRQYCAKTCNACAPINQNCKDLDCQHRCVRKGDSSYACECFDGYRLDENGQTCTDIDECAENPNLCLNTSASQCYNTPGSYRCTICKTFKLGPASYWNYYRKEECCKQNAKNYFQCGSSFTNGGRVVGGRNALVANWPWMAYISIVNNICGGTLIGDEWVLTAAHCVSSFKNSPSSIRVILGVLRTSPDSGNLHEQSRTVRQVFVHENYSYPNNDIALIRLRRKANIGNFVGTVCLPNGEEPKNGEICVATGYGTTTYRGSQASILQEVDLPIVNNEVCQRAYRNYTENMNPDVHICAGYEEGGRDTCQGDSGGPLVCQRCKNCDWYIAGVTSFGRECALAGYYGVYTRVTSFESWISGITSISVTNEECKPAEWTSWGAFTPCSVECGGGTKSRIRYCKYGSANIDIGCQGDTEETMDCNTQSCEVAIWSNYNIGICSKTCGGGTRTNSRDCINGSPGDKGCEGSVSMTEDCNEQPCPVWGEYEAWSECTKECDTGTQIATRECMNGDVGQDGCQGQREKSQNCNTHLCNRWEPWVWTDCSKSCGTGTRSATRQCVGGIVPGEGCVGPSKMSEDCNAQICAHWSEYEPWSNCDDTCMESKERHCVGGQIGNDGCIGDAIATQTCCEDFGQWSEYGDCSETCGGGERTRTRNCPDPIRCLPDEHGTSTSQTQPCNIDICPGKWTGWSNKGGCSIECGEGQQEQVRSCEGGVIGGPGCEGDPARFITCTGDPVWGDWGEYSDCSKTCGNGVKIRTRICCGGEGKCEGNKQQEMQCSLSTCPATDDCAKFVNIADRTTCEQFAKQDYCKTFKDYMNQNCRLACCRHGNGGNSITNCDLSPLLCPFYVAQCHLPQVQENCRSTCRLPCP